VTADGRILVLEQGNARIQAIDVNANPVACFNAASLGSVPPSFATDLDNGLVSTALRSAFAAAGVRLSSVWRIQDPTTIYQLAAGAGAVAVTIGGASPSTQWTLTDSSAVPQAFNLTLSGASINVARRGTPLFSAGSEAAPKLNAGLLSRNLAAAFAASGVTLTAPLRIAGNGLTLDLSVIGELSTGRIPASLAPALAAAGITLGSPGSVTASVAVRVIQSSARWQLVDRSNNTTYALDRDPTRGNIDLVELSAVAALVPPPPGQTLTYLSMAAEAKGYIYVLSYTGTGNDIENFLLDIYSPDGSPLARTTGVNAGDIVVDMWRNLYTLNFESLLGPAGRTEPSISIWTPSV
jgi:hypothetical protein